MTIEQPKTIIVNLFAGPGTGKSTAMAGIFSRLKLLGVNCEMAHEYAKEKVWEESYKILHDQIYVFGKQLHKIHRLIDKVDVVITDSPLLLSIIYGNHETDKFVDLVLEVFNRFDNRNYFLQRIKEYNPSGRMQDFDEAKEIDRRILSLLEFNKFPYNVKVSCEKTMDEIAQEIHSEISNRK